MASQLLSVWHHAVGLKGMVGKVTTQGDRVMRSDKARRDFHLDGTGITIGVISDSFNAQGGARGDVVSGDLPGRENPNGYRQAVRVLKDVRSPSATDEGRAMLQIIHDIAPGTRLLFHEGGDNETTFAQAIQALADAGADIIVDDLGYSNAPLFQDGIAARAVTEVANRGVFYFSAAGNDGARGYESAFRPDQSFSFRGNAYQAHDFDASEGIDLFQEIQLPANSVIDLVLNWDQPAGQTATDLEVFLLDQPQFPGKEAQVLRTAEYFSDRVNDPARQLAYHTRSRETAYLLVARKSEGNGSPPAQIKWISVANNEDAEVKYEYVNDGFNKSVGSTVYGHPNAREAIAIGAAPYQQTPMFGVNPIQPRNSSSRGQSVILFDAQGNRLTTPEIRLKPELIAPDGIRTTMSVFSPFLGTSAAAPHAAAIAALMLQRAGGRRSLNRTQLLAALQETALPALYADGSNSLAGFIQADAAVLRSFQAERLGTKASELILGTAIAENFVALAGDDMVQGAGGADALFGGTGRDRLHGEDGNDYLLGQDGGDWLIGGAGQDALHGGSGRDRIWGSRGNDWLEGNGGNDWLRGGLGTNVVKGGNGKDVFVLERVGKAIITDFEVERDRLELGDRLKFGQLTMTQRQRDTIITVGKDVLAQLNGIDADTLTNRLFISA
jgi:Ca2+-binding RTX toxin-like protein